MSIIGRTHPEIFDILGNPYGPLAHDRGQQVALNPQPLPPLSVGVLAGQELVRLAFTASRLHIAFDVDPDEWCPRPPGRPKFPPIPWPPIKWAFEANPELDRQWAEEYATGLALAIEASTHMWEGLAAAAALAAVHEVAIRSVGND